MVNEIELLVCDNCNTVMQAEVWRGHTCMYCGNEMIAAKFERQPTQRAADGGDSLAETELPNDEMDDTFDII